MGDGMDDLGGEDDIPNEIPDFAATQVNVTDEPPPSPDEVYGEDDDDELADE
jgi:hypothetical protein